MIKFSTTLAILAERDIRIDEYEHDECDGHFLHLAYGYHESDYGAHSIRSDTLRGVLDKLHLIELYI